MMAVSSQWPMSLLATLLTSAGLMSLSSVIEAAPRFHDDRPDLSTSAIIQTLGNVFRLPEILGGRINADSDVRFGLASAPEDPLVDVVERFEPSGSRGARLFNDEEYGDIAGPSPTRFAEDYGKLTLKIARVLVLLLIILERFFAMEKRMNHVLAVLFKIDTILETANAL